MEDCELVDFELKGYQFTWERGRVTNSWVEACLDKALVNYSWIDMFKEARLSNIELTNSDHCPLFLEPEVQVFSQCINRFKFENSWLREPMCEQLVRSVWDEYGNGNIQMKISKCGDVLADWGKEITGCFKERLKRCKARMKELRRQRDVVSLKLYEEEKQNFYEILNQKECFWKQRAKQFWLKEGDRNSKYFHAVASRRKRNNQIVKLQNNNGEWVTWEDGIPELMKGYFDNLFTAMEVQIGDLLDEVRPSVTVAQNEVLMSPVSEEEVKAALFQMYPDKAPGPDGMRPGFYQKMWHIVGKDVVKITQEFFHTCEFPNGLNDTNIVFIPKNKSPMKMSDFRPISLCNVLYKVISKVMANRMKVVLPQLII